jgi:hypothetical protein
MYKLDKATSPGPFYSALHFNLFPRPDVHPWQRIPSYSLLTARTADHIAEQTHPHSCISSIAPLLSSFARSFGNWLHWYIPWLGSLVRRRLTPPYRNRFPSYRKRPTTLDERSSASTCLRPSWPHSAEGQGFQRRGCQQDMLPLPTIASRG